MSIFIGVLKIKALMGISNGVSVIVDFYNMLYNLHFFFRTVGLEYLTRDIIHKGEVNKTVAFFMPVILLLIVNYEELLNILSRRKWFMYNAMQKTAKFWIDNHMRITFDEYNTFINPETFTAIFSYDQFNILISLGMMLLLLKH